MSQRMQYNEEASGDYQAGYMLSPDQEQHFHPQPGPGYTPRYDEYSMQKLNARFISQPLSPGARLALAIVSVVTLIPLISMMLGDPDLSFSTLIFRIAGLGMACLTLMVVNIAFNWSVGRKK